MKLSGEKKKSCTVHWVWLKMILSSMSLTAHVNKCLYCPVLVDNRTGSLVTWRYLFSSLLHMPKVEKWNTTNLSLSVVFFEAKFPLHLPWRTVHPSQSNLYLFFLPLSGSVYCIYCTDKRQQQTKKLNCAVRIRPFRSRLSLHEQQSGKFVYEAADTN